MVNKIESISPVKVTKAKLLKGSVILEVEVEQDTSPTVQSDTTDLNLIVTRMISQIKGETIEVDGLMLVAENPSITDFVTMTPGPPVSTKAPATPDDSKFRLILGIVGGAIALILLIAGACVAYNRTKSDKSSSMQFSDLSGKDAPTSHNKA